MSPSATSNSTMQASFSGTDSYGDIAGNLSSIPSAGR